MNSNLKKQFIDYMTLQRFALATKKNYIVALEGLEQFHHQSPETLNQRTDSGVSAVSSGRPQALLGDV